MGLKIFITHSWHDIDFARQLYDDLIAQGLDVWFDDKTLQGGHRMAEEINRGLEWCDIYLPILSPESLDSPWCWEEINTAIALSNEKVREGRPRVIPIIAKNCQIPAILRGRLYINFTGQDSNPFKKLLAAIETFRLERERKTQERADREKAEQLAREKAEQKRIAKETAEIERLARERAVKERIAKENAEKERLARERADAERLTREKAEAERLVRENAKAEKLAREKVEQQRLARENAHAEWLGSKKKKVLGIGVVAILVGSVVFVATLLLSPTATSTNISLEPSTQTAFLSTSTVFVTQQQIANTPVGFIQTPTPTKSSTTPPLIPASATTPLIPISTSTNTAARSIPSITPTVVVTATVSGLFKKLDPLLSSNGASQVYVTDINTGSRQQVITTGTWESISSAVWSLDGKRILASIALGDYNGSSKLVRVLRVMDAQGKGGVDIAKSGPNDGDNYRTGFQDTVWSPDEQKIATHRATQNDFGVFLLNSDGTRLEHLASSETSDWPRFWSVDGKWVIAVSASDNAFYALEVDGNKRVPLAQLGGLRIYDERYHPWHVTDSPKCTLPNGWSITTWYGSGSFWYCE